LLIGYMVAKVKNKGWGGVRKKKTCRELRGAFKNKLQSVNIFLDIYF
jgi:hypothetical protein